MIWSRRAWISFAVWSSLLLAVAVWELQCDHRLYDRKASKELGCTVTTTGADGKPKCFEPGPLCATASTIAAWAPKWFSKGAVVVGPALVWVPLLVHILLAQHGELAAWVVYSAVAWLALSMPLRFTTLALGWDPSGHVLVIGLQLVPLFLLVQQEGSKDARRAGRPAGLPYALIVAEVLGCVLSAITLATGAFFHSATEVGSAWLVVLGVMTAFQVFLPAESLTPGRRSKLYDGTRQALAVGGVICLVSGVAAVVVLPSMTVARILPFALHDTVLFAVMLGLVVPACFSPGVKQADLLL